MSKRFVGDEAGAALVEFALIGSLFLLLVNLVIQGMFVFNTWLVVTEAATDGARYGAPCYNRPVSPCSATAVTTYVQNDAPNLQTSKLTITVTAQNKILTVNASYPVSIYAPLFSIVIPDPLTVSGSASMPTEN